MIPHKRRKYRAILDLSFCLRTSQPVDCQRTSVNEQTIAQAPHQAMDQLGKALQCIIATLATA